MAENEKAPPPAELSLKYMAWNVKQMDENIKKIASALAELVEILKNRRQGGSGGQQDEIPF